jgi:hypothetical protein
MQCDGLKSSQRSSLSLFKAQSDSVLEKYSPIPSRGRKRKNIRATASFTANEFARVVTILTTDQGVRRALLRSGLDLTRGELDRGVGRDDFWVQQVEPLMNDPALVFELFDHATPLSLAPNAPLSDARAGELLKQKFYEARGHFTRWYSNWNVSGNYSAENFHLFVAPPQTGSTTYPNTSLCAMILFHALRCGMEDADVEILNFVAKTAEEECVYDDATEDNSVLSSRKKNRALSLEGDANLTFLPVLRQVWESIAELASASTSARGEKAVEEKESEAVRSSHMSSLVADMQRLSTDIRTAKKEGEDQEIIEVMQDELNNLLNVIRRLRMSRPI